MKEAILTFENFVGRNFGDRWLETFWVKTKSPSCLGSFRAIVTATIRCDNRFCVWYHGRFKFNPYSNKWELWDRTYIQDTVFIDGENYTSPLLNIDGDITWIFGSLWNPNALFKLYSRKNGLPSEPMEYIDFLPVRNHNLVGE